MDLTPFLARTRLLESGGGKFLSGDNGRARGPWHMHQAAWADVTKARKAAGKATITWAKGTQDAHWAEVYAREYAEMLRRRLVNELGWYSDATLYAAWNAGITRVLRLNGQWHLLKCSKRCAGFNRETIYASQLAGTL